MTNFEDVFGAEQAGKELRARQYAALQELAIRTGDVAAQSAILFDAAQAGLVRYLRAARRELVAVYQLDDRAPEDALETLRRMIEPVIDESSPDDPGVENYHRSDGTPL